MRSSSTRARVSALSGSASEREAETVPILTLKRREEKESLTQKVSPSSTSLPGGDFLRTFLPLTQARDWRARLRSPEAVVEEARDAGAAAAAAARRSGDRVS